MKETKKKKHKLGKVLKYIKPTKNKYTENIKNITFKKDLRKPILYSRIKSIGSYIKMSNIMFVMEIQIKTIITYHCTRTA